MKREERKSATDFSHAVRNSFKKRSRALSRRGATVDCTPVKEIVNGKESRVNRTDVTISYRLNAARVNIRLQVWADRWVWFDARSGSKSGWVWEYTTEGRFVSDNGARDLVMRTEKSMDASHIESSKVAAEMEVIWSTCLATGPRADREIRK